MPNIVTSRTRTLYERPPQGPWCPNLGSLQAVGLRAWWPLGEGAGATAFDETVGTARNLSFVNGPAWAGAGPGVGGNAVKFVSASSQYLLLSSAVLTAVPVTLACWFRTDNTGAIQCPLALDLTTGVNNNQFRLLFSTVFQASAQATATTGTAQSAAAVQADRWHHGCGVFAAANSRAAFLDGRDKGTNTTSVTPSGINSAQVGTRFSAGARTNYMSGLIADARVYNRALSDAEVYALYDPRSRWELYYPLGRRTYSFPVAGASPLTGGPAAAANDTSAGVSAWLNPSRATSDDGQYSYAVGFDGDSTYYLVLTGFGFLVPPGATVTGFTVQVNRHAEATSASVQDAEVRLVYGGAVTGDNKGDLNTNWPTSAATASYGGASDKWSLSPTPSGVNASDFGVALRADFVGGSDSVEARVDWVKVTAHYSLGGVAASQTRMLLLGVGV